MSVTRHFVESAVAEAASNACSMLAAVDFGTFVGWDPSCTPDLGRGKNVVKSSRRNCANSGFIKNETDKYILTVYINPVKESQLLRF